MKYYKRQGIQSDNPNVIIGIIYPENDKPNNSPYTIKEYVDYFSDKYIEVTEIEYWEQEFDADKLVEGAYYVVIDYFNIFKYNENYEADYYTGNTCTTFNRNGGNFNSDNISNKYRLATDEEIEWLEACNKADKFITKEEFMKNKEFVLPEKWCVKRTPENAGILNNWANQQKGVSGTSAVSGWINSTNFNDIGYLGDGHYHASTTKVSDHIEITFEQFQKYVLKINNMYNKELIGYKLNGVVSKEIADRVIGWTSTDYDGLYFVKGHLAGSLVNEAKKLDILDKWFEPVYGSDKPKIFIKDYEAIFTDNTVKFGCQTYNKDFVLQLGNFLNESGLILDYGKEVMQVVDYFRSKESNGVGYLKEYASSEDDDLSF